MSKLVDHGNAMNVLTLEALLGLVNLSKKIQNHNHPSTRFWRGNYDIRMNYRAFGDVMHLSNEYGDPDKLFSCQNSHDIQCNPWSITIKHCLSYPFNLLPINESRGVGSVRGDQQT